MKYKILFIFLTLSAVNCQFSKTTFNEKYLFEVIAYNTVILLETDSLSAGQGGNSYLTELSLVNKSNVKFEVNLGKKFIPFHSQTWRRDELGRYINYEYFKDSLNYEKIEIEQLDTIDLYLKEPTLVVFDSILFRPELVLNNRRYRLEYMFRKNEEGTGYYLKDSTSNALMMRDTIADYSNYNIGIE